MVNPTPGVTENTNGPSTSMTTAAVAFDGVKTGKPFASMPGCKTSVDPVEGSRVNVPISFGNALAIAVAMLLSDATTLELAMVNS